MAEDLAHTDLDELLEVYDAAGLPTGIAKTRAAVHRDGDWHLAFFCWILRGNDEVLLQRRASTKDVWPGRFDASAAGHFRYGETTSQAAREIEEELGLHVEPDALHHLMFHRQEHVHENGLVDREIHDVHLLRCDLPLESYRPGPEVSGIASVNLRAIIDMMSGTRTSIWTSLVTFDAVGVAGHESIALMTSDLVPYHPAYWGSIYSGRASIARR
jgi:isopentenyldiphosphate isomerase